MIAASQNGSHSARVEMALIVASQRFEIAQATPTHLYLRTPTELTAGTGVLSISIDGNVTQQTVQLPGDIQPSSLVVPFQRIG